LGDQTEEYFRLWYTDHAIHGGAKGQLDDPTRVISYTGLLQQALRDLSAWVEKGIAPAPSTNYQIKDGQVATPETAADRRGIQAIVNASVNGRKHSELKTNETLQFLAKIEIPANTGKLVEAAWDFDGSGEFKNQVDLSNAKISENGTQVEFSISHQFEQAGTFFPSLRIATQREGDTATPFARIPNIDRVKVIVKE
jgi:hypothetical protein